MGNLFHLGQPTANKYVYIMRKPVPNYVIAVSRDFLVSIQVQYLAQSTLQKSFPSNG